MKLEHLQLNCSNLEELKHFYTHKLRFAVKAHTEDSFTIQIGESMLTFRENKLQNFYYHFAFNIPYFMVEKALSWVKKRTVVLQFNGSEIQDFSAWDAKAFYFVDPAQNVVELIGRRPLDYPNHRRFSAKCIHNISEVGLPVTNTAVARQYLQQTTQTPEFGRNGDNFTACGNHEGLLIVVDKNEKEWFPTNAQARCYPFSCRIKEGNANYDLSVSGGELYIAAAQ